MRIKLISMKDYKCVKNFRFAPGDNHMILIGGLNKQGKSTVLGAMSACLGGKNEEPEIPIRVGEKQSDIEIELESDLKELEYTVHKRFLKSGNSSLKVTGKDGKLTAPQKILDRILGSRFLDPLKFMRLPAKEQQEALLKVVDIGINLADWAKERKKHFDARTDSNRDLKRHLTELDNNPDPGEIPEENSSDLVGKVEELIAKDTERTKAETALGKSRERYENTKILIAKMEKDLAETTARMEKDLAETKELFEEVKVTGKANAAAFEAMPDIKEDLEKAKTELRESSAKQEERLRLVAQRERHVAAVALVGKTEALSKELTEMLETMDKKRADKLSAAKMPIDGLSVGDNGLIFNKLPLSQASGAQKLAVSLALAAAMSPELDDIWVEDGALMDENSLKQMSEFAEKNKKRFWIERVGEGDEGAIIMEAGEIKETKAA